MKQTESLSQPRQEMINGLLECGWPERTSQVLWFSSQVKKQAMRCSWKMAGWTRPEPLIHFYHNKQSQVKQAWSHLGFLIPTMYRLSCDMCNTGPVAGLSEGVGSGPTGCLTHQLSRDQTSLPASCFHHRGYFSPSSWSPSPPAKTKVTTDGNTGFHWGNKRSPRGILGNLQPHTGAPA